jgi:hypothetical protein
MPLKPAFAAAFHGVEHPYVVSITVIFLREVQITLPKSDKAAVIKKIAGHTCKLRPISRRCAIEKSVQHEK